MNEDRFDELMRAAGPDYNRPPEPPLDEMWAAIDKARHTPETAPDEVRRPRPFLSEPQRRAFWQQPWLRMAAVLIVGLALGRWSAALSNRSDTTLASAPEPAAAVSNDEASGRYQAVTVSYLGETAALLVALPGELRNQRADSSFVARADDLLLQTRLLLDSPAASEPALRALFEDLEVVLAQVVRLQADRDPTRIELLNQALEQNEVMPRLRNAVVNHIAD